MSFKSIIFGTDGWRGLIDVEINENTVAIVAQAFAEYLKIEKGEKAKAAIGYDGRKFSYQYAKIFAEVLSGNGIQAFLSNSIIPTPTLSFYVKRNALEAGVMITASHNPPEYNGVKFKAHYGGPFFTEETQKVESLLGKSEIRKSASNVILTDILTPYFMHLKAYVNFNKIADAKLFPIIDSMGGAGNLILSKLLDEFQITNQTIYGKPDESFYNRYPEPIEKNLTPLKEKLLEGKFTIGLATDGDADRCGILLENGEWLNIQYLILSLMKYVVERRKFDGHLAKTASVTGKANQFFENENRKVFDAQVGFKYLCEKMLEYKIAGAFEESGGFGFQNHIPERDGILSNLLVLEMLADSGYDKASKFFEEQRKYFGEIYYKRIDLKYEKEDRIELLPNLKKENPDKMGPFKIKDIAEYFSSRGITNGLKFYLEGDSRWLLIRASETEPLLRFYAEGQNAKETEEILKAGLKILGIE